MHKGIKDLLYDEAKELSENSESNKSVLKPRLSNKLKNHKPK